MKIGLLCADMALRQLAVKRISDLPQFELEWYCSDAAEAQRQPAVALLLVAAAQCTGELVQRTQRHGGSLVALVNELARDCDALYAALDAGAQGFVELDSASGNALADKLLRLSRQQSTVRSHQLPLIAIGASAGGPAALRSLLAALPADLPAAVLVVQHYEGEGIASLCDWLAQTAALSIRPALDGVLPEAGVVYLAEGGRHLQLDRDGRFQLAGREVGDLHCPSVDRLFNNLCAQSDPGIAVLLTGMGRDGAAGLLKLRQRGWYTLTQDASATVDGMPRAARELEAAVAVLPLEQITTALRRALERRVAA